MRRHAKHAAVLALALILGNSVARAQVAVLSARSLDSLRGDVPFFAEFNGMGELRSGYEAYLKAVGGPNPEGIDRGRPLGAYVHWPVRPDRVFGLEWPAVFF